MPFTLVVASEIKWRYMRTRKQYLLSAWPAGWEVIFLEPVAFGKPNTVRPHREGHVTYMTVPFLKAGTTSAIYNALTRNAAGRAAVVALSRAWTRRVLRRAGAGDESSRVLMVSNVLAWPAVRTLRRRLAVYDMNDDAAGFHPDVPWVAEHAKATIKEVDLVVACSEGLARRAREAGASDVVVIGNGVNAGAFSTPRPTPERMAPYPRPRVGYLGAIGPWVDFALLRRVAALPRVASVVLVGPVQPAAQQELERLLAEEPKVAALGEVPYTDVPGYVEALDVCLIPFHRSSQTNVLNPNKLYEYFAAGRTVVSLDYSEEITRLDGRLYLASDAGGFVDAVERAIAAPIDGERVREVARDNSWETKARLYADTILHRLHP
jgi:hypothetical protein